MIEAPQIEGSLEPHMGFGGKVAQVAEILDKGACRPVGKNVVNARRVGALSDAVPVLQPPVCVFKVIWGAFGDVGPPMLEHVEEVWVAVNVGIGIHTDEVGSGPDSGGSTVSKPKDIGAVPSRAAVDAGDVDACRAKVVSSPPALALGTERLENLVPALGGLEARDAWRGVISGGVDDGVFGEDGDTTIVARGASDSVISAAVGGLAD